MGVSKVQNEPDWQSESLFNLQKHLYVGLLYN